MENNLSLHTLLDSRRIRITLWIIYFLFPLFSGISQYNWLPDESYDEKIHELISSHEDCEDFRPCVDRPEVWRNLKTGKILTPEEFSWHRNAESIRMACTYFAYGIIGCFFFALISSRAKPGSFYESLGKALCVNICIAGITFVTIRWL